MMTLQEIFNRVKAHLLTQNAKARIPDGGWGYGACRYRGTNGLKCAIGCLIPDEAYTADLEGSVLFRVLSTIPGIPTSAGRNDPTYVRYEILLAELQSIHDRYQPPEWAEQLERLGKRHNLEC